MKLLLASSLVVLAAGLSAPSLAADHNHGTMHAPAQADSPLVEGLVKKVDKAAGKVTVSHGVLPNGMPGGMTMVFRVKEAAWIDQIKPGQKIRFAADELKGTMTIVRFEPVK